MTEPETSPGDSDLAPLRASSKPGEHAESPGAGTGSTPTTRPPVVEFRGVAKTYGAGTSRAFTAIRDVTFTVEDRPDHGEFIAILGPSGCGKSTILRLIAGLSPQHPATEGDVLVCGSPIAGPGADRGMVFQDYTSFDHRTVLDNVCFGLECQGVPRKVREDLGLAWIGRMQLDKDKDARKYPHELSGGMRQRVAIARSLILAPRIMLMDEPFGALDPLTRMRMQDLLVSLWRDLQATVFFVTHSIEEAVYLGDRIYIISPSPGTILREIQVPSPDRPAMEMQREPAFMEQVFEIREIIEKLEEEVAKRRGEAGPKAIAAPRRAKPAPPDVPVCPSCGEPNPVGVLECCSCGCAIPPGGRET